MASEGVRSMILSEFKDLQHRCHHAMKSSKEQGSVESFLDKCMMKCQGVTSNFPVCVSGGQVNYYIQQYAEAILDFTYHDENQLTTQEFPEKDSKDRISQIFGYLGKIGTMCEMISAGTRLEDLLGNEIAECIQWRQGALLYMYCSTIQENKDRLKRQAIEYRQSLQKGVYHIQRLFKIRDLVFDSTHVPGDNDTFELLKTGIYSDTHLLALMYGGEMCYWFVTSSSAGIGEQERDARDVGRDMLNTYIQSIDRLPILQASWSTDRAKQILAELRPR